MGTEVFLSDIDIAHHVPTRQQNGALKPVICKFVRRLAKASVMETRQSASQVNPSNIGLSTDSVLDRVRIFDHLTPKKQHLLFEAKRKRGKQKRMEFSGYSRSKFNCDKRLCIETTEN